MKHLTHDRGRFFTVLNLGEKRSTTPEGFLVCHDVPIARTGTQLYIADELLDDDGKPVVEAGPDGLIRIERIADEVFRPETLASFEGKPVTINHPDEFVTPENHRALSVGLTQNVRRGQGIEDDLIIADLVITDAKAIEYVNKELPEVSAGYEAVYQQTDVGRGVQREIVGNHVALVERGRAGPRCSIQDKEPDMKTKDAKTAKRGFWDRLKTAVMAKDADAVKAELAEAGDEFPDSKMDEDDDKSKAKSGDAAILALTKAVTKLTGDVAALAKKVKDSDEETEEERKKREAEEAAAKAKDTVLEAEGAASNPDALGKVLSGDSLKTVISQAEILAPGIKVPTGDSVKVADVEQLQREALTKAASTDSGKKLVDVMLRGRDLAKLTGDSLADVYHGVASVVAAQNNASGSRRAAPTRDFGKATTVADINEKNRKFWDSRNQ